MREFRDRSSTSFCVLHSLFCLSIHNSFLLRLLPDFPCVAWLVRFYLISLSSQSWSACNCLERRYRDSGCQSELVESSSTQNGSWRTKKSPHHNWKKDIRDRALLYNSVFSCLINYDKDFRGWGVIHVDSTLIRLPQRLCKAFLC